jgi:hypothetical protein
MGAPQSPITVSFPSGFARNPPPAFWKTVMATADLVRDSATARIIDPIVVVPMTAGKTYYVRGYYYWTAEAGGPSILVRLNGPALTLLNIQRGIVAGAQTNTSMNIGTTARMAYDAADVSTTWNTGGPARALGYWWLDGLVTPSASGNFGLEWTGNSALWAFTRLKGSYLEYREMP